jgi:hypothetical protein
MHPVWKESILSSASALCANASASTSVSSAVRPWNVYSADGTTASGSSTSDGVRTASETNGARLASATPLRITSATSSNAFHRASPIAHRASAIDDCARAL